MHQDVSLFNLLLQNLKDAIIRRGMLNDMDYAALMDELRQRLFKVPEIGTSSLPRKNDNGYIEKEPVIYRVKKEISHREATIREMNVEIYEDETKSKGVRTVSTYILFCYYRLTFNF